MTPYVPRYLASIVTEALKEMPVVVISGARQTGKSMFLQNQAEFGTRAYITLDDFEILEAAKTSPRRLITAQTPLTIDEVQRCPEIFMEIKSYLEKVKKPGMFLLSGSANFSMLKKVSETLAGRAIYYPMRPMIRREIIGKRERPFLLEWFEKKSPSHADFPLPPILEKEVLLGGFPPVVLNQAKNRELWFKGFKQTYIERDVQQFARITNTISFKNLLELTAFRSGNLLSQSQLGRDAGLNVMTTGRYLSLFETSFLITRITPFLKNRSQRLIKSPKIFFCDSGLACYLSRVTAPFSDPLGGAMFETYVAQNLQGIIDQSPMEVSLHFWNIQGRHEVDFIIDGGRNCLAVEVKMGERWHPSDFSGLRHFLEKTPACFAGVLAYNGVGMAKQIDEKLWTIPLGLLLS